MFLSCKSICDSSHNSGDSYSSTGYDIHGANPSADNPLGNPPYPGDTYSGGPTWVSKFVCTLTYDEVGYLCTEYKQSPILAYNFAVPGVVVQRLTAQIKECFLPHAGKKPEWAPWTSKNSLFCILIQFLPLTNSDMDRRQRRWHGVEPN